MNRNVKAGFKGVDRRGPGQLAGGAQSNRWLLRGKFIGEAKNGLGLIRVVSRTSDGISNQEAVLALIEAGVAFLILWLSRWCGNIIKLFDL